MADAARPLSRILILAGTREARALAERLAEDAPHVDTILSLAGITRAPRPVGVSLRIGGFGGPDGLAATLRQDAVSLLVDAAHPFAARMHAHAAQGAAAAGIPRILLLRPPWPLEEGWHAFPDIAAAGYALPSGARPFLALGQQHLAGFPDRADIAPVLRMAQAPSAPLPLAARIVVGPPAADARAERALFLRHGITHLVCRNSGGSDGAGKLRAATALGIPVLMVQRPEPPPGPSVATVDAAMDEILRLL
ncbi:precorrin-6A/cobalt-precorrin-6A reductase [Aureimonas frigidaquae]|uniref:precorrin-6A/cobalt-precorrin-6A reductase n=1 Tax=Aureimonas frigidaquae TaxID=424757 RepID=UPI0007844DFE|nr:precorrin-6A/cobalt-precorrin-6A reductase [Aureimonas frigidaquae]